MSNCLQPFGLHPASLLCPWVSPGKNTGVGAISSSRDLPDSGIERSSLVSPALQANSLPLSHWGGPFLPGAEIPRWSLPSPAVWCQASLSDSLVFPHPCLLFYELCLFLPAGRIWAHDGHCSLFIDSDADCHLFSDLSSYLIRVVFGQRGSCNFNAATRMFLATGFRLHMSCLRSSFLQPKASRSLLLSY